MCKKANKASQDNVIYEREGLGKGKVREGSQRGEGSQQRECTRGGRGRRK